jgi:hypothetical protein
MYVIEYAEYAQKYTIYKGEYAEYVRKYDMKYAEYDRKYDRKYVKVIKYMQSSSGSIFCILVILVIYMHSPLC